MKKDVIQGFKGEYSFLSPFYPSRISYEGNIFKSVIHFYVFHKTYNDNEKALILSKQTPYEIYNLGKNLKFKSKEWKNIKERVMFTGYVLYLNQNSDFTKSLLETSNSQLIHQIIPPDKYWGTDQSTGEGRNRLGAILSTIRYIFFKIIKKETE
uniref:NADAR domain-containing protein n=1 Tax=viral metagenome TaxID=1070528 RepID=A0A6M3LEL2_9ZZZZ